RKQDFNQSTHNMGVAVASEREHWPACAIGLNHRREPDLAGAALHLVGVGTGAFRQWLERTAKLDDVPITVVPFLQQRKILDDFVERGGIGCECGHCSGHTGYIGASIDLCDSCDRERTRLIRQDQLPAGASRCGCGPRQAGARSVGDSVCCEGRAPGSGTAFLPVVVTTAPVSLGPKGSLRDSESVLAPAVR